MNIGESQKPQGFFLSRLLSFCRSLCLSTSSNLRDRGLRKGAEAKREKEKPRSKATMA
jgi:hypothetical protein